MGRILVIDDEPSTRVLFKSRLEDLGHRVTLAANGAAGLMAAQAAGMRAVAYVGGSHAGPANLRQSVENLAPMAIISDMADLPALIRGGA